MNRALTATQRYRWALEPDGADEATHRRRAEAALAAITDDVRAMTVVIDFPAGLRFQPERDDPPTRLPCSGLASLSTNPARAVAADDPCDPYTGDPATWF